MSNTTLKVLTERVSINEENYVLVELQRTDIENAEKMYGTISYKELDEKGCMKRELNGLEMCCSYDIPHAIMMREDEIATRNMSIEEMANYFRRKVSA